VDIVHHYSITFYHGGEKMIISIASELLKKGYTVSIFSLPLKKSGRNISIPLFYKEYFSKKLTGDIAYYIYVPLIYKLFRTSAPKIAGIHSFIVWPKFSHIPVSFPQFLYRHGILACGAIYFNYLTRNIDLRNFDAIHVPNIIAPEHVDIPIYTIPNWVDLQVFKPRKNKSDVFTIIFVGSSKWSKGYDIFYSIARYLSKKISKIRFLAVGIGKGNSLVKSYPFIYKDNLLANIYSSSHLLIHPSRADIFGITLLESLACGTPVLTSPLPSHQAFLPSYYICHTLRDYIYKALNIYRAWCSESDEYRLLTINARELASNFDKKKIFPLFEKMLIEVASKK